MDYIKLKTTVGLTCAAIGGCLSSLLGGWDTWLKVLVTFVALDYLSGLLAALVEKRLNSEIGFRGVTKKVFIFILVAVAYRIDQLAGTQIIRIAVIAFYIGTEGLSILKNAGRAGLPLPAILTAALEELRKKGEQKGAQKEVEKNVQRH